MSLVVLALNRISNPSVTDRILGIVSASAQDELEVSDFTTITSVERILGNVEFMLISEEVVHLVELQVDPTFLELDECKCLSQRP